MYQNKLDKTCFQHEMAYGTYEYLPRRTASDRVFRDKTFEIAHNSKYYEYQRRLVSIVCNFLAKNLEVLLTKEQEKSLRITN